MKHIAIPIQGNRLSSAFGTCDFLQLFTTTDQKIKASEMVIPVSGSVEEIAAQLTALNIGIVITEYMEPDMIGYLAQQKIQVFIGVKNNDPEVLVRHFLDGQLLSDQKVMQLNNN